MAVTSACGEEDEPPCAEPDEIREEICTRACECGGARDWQCAYGGVRFQDFDDCMASIYVGAIGWGEFQCDLCREAIPDAQCVETTAGSALDPPEECRTCPPA